MRRCRNAALFLVVLFLFLMSSAQSQPQPPLRRQAAMTPPPPPALEPDVTLTSVFNVRIPSLAQDCSHEWLDVGHSIELWIRVETGDSQSVALSIVLAPREDVVLEKILNFEGIIDDAGVAAEGHVLFTATRAGVHSVCVENRFSNAPMLVRLAVLDQPAIGDSAIAHHSRIAARIPTAATSELHEFHRAAASLSHRIDDIEFSQLLMRDREQQHRDTIESTFTRMGMFFAAECILLALLAAVQLLVVRGWFGDSRQAGRV